MSRGRRGATASGRRAATGPLLDATLRTTSGDPVEIRCDAGEIVRLPDDDRVLAALVGEQRRSADRVELAGRRLARRAPAGRVRAGLAVVRGAEVAADVTVLDHLAAATDRRRAAELLAGSPLLADRADDPAGVLSGGERRVLGWLLARAVDPRVVVLDRAGTGLDDDSLRWAHGVVDGWLDDGAGLLVREGRAEEARWRTHLADGAPRATRGPRDDERDDERDGV
jgi:ABC-type lipopolysaccharide export system ATPase subunit